MAVTAHSSGSQTATITTQHTLGTDPATAGTYTLHVDVINMASGDALELRIYQKILTAGTLRVAYFVRYDNAQPTDDMIKISVPISNDLVEANALSFRLTQVAGTGRVFPWKILKYA